MPLVREEVIIVSHDDERKIRLLGSFNVHNFYLEIRGSEIFHRNGSEEKIMVWKNGKYCDKNGMTRGSYRGSSAQLL